MRKGFAIGLIALAVSCRLAGAQTNTAPPANAPSAAPTPQMVPLPANGAAPVWHDAPDHGGNWFSDWGNGDHGDGGSGGHLDAGFEALIIRPYFVNNPALTTTVSTSPSTTTTLTSQGTSNFDYEYTVNPRIWLGYVMDCGLGFRVGWWRFDQASNSPTAVQTSPVATGTLVSVNPVPAPFGFNVTAPTFTGDPGVPLALATTSDLRVDVWDFEATAAWHAGGFIVEGSAGVRYLHLEQSYGAFAAQGNIDAAGDTRNGTVIFGHSFNGAGPTLALLGRHGLGDMGLGVYASARGAVLFGSSKSNGTELVTTTAPDGSNVETTGLQSHSDHLGVLGIGECEVGVEYSRKMGDSADVFLRAGIDGQIWIGGGSATTADSTFGFFGYTVTIGVNY
jgi:hypothetical protein